MANPFELLEKLEALADRADSDKPNAIDQAEYAMLLDNLGESLHDLFVRLQPLDIIKIVAQTYADDDDDDEDDPLSVEIESIEMSSCHDVTIKVNMTPVVQVGENLAEERIEGAEEALRNAREAATLASYDGELLADIGTLAYLRSQRAAKTSGSHVQQRVEQLQRELAPHAAAMIERYIAGGLLAMEGDDELVATSWLSADERRVLLNTATAARKK